MFLCFCIKQKNYPRSATEQTILFYSKLQTKKWYKKNVKHLLHVFNIFYKKKFSLLKTIILLSFISIVPEFIFNKVVSFSPLVNLS